MRQTDTIASVATGMTDAGIGIIRLSGPDAVACAETITEKPLKEREANTICYNRVLDKDGSVMDEVLVSVLRSPHSYTGEDTVEINTHGGRLVMERVLLRLLSASDGLLRIAEPGEFSKRAFLNGKMDLTKAEAVQDLITAKTAFAAKNAALQLTGVLETRVRSMREALLHESAFIEAALDDPDVYERELSVYGKTIRSVVSDIGRQIDALLESFDEGVLRKDGVRCAIIGPPNAGKSTLLNLLAQTERAIVTDVPGTTRDIIEETVKIGELVLRVQDTAGIRHSDDTVEQIGITRAVESAKQAELILLVLDASQGIAEEAKELIPLTQQKHSVILLNKTDLLSGQSSADIRRNLAAEPGNARIVIETSFLNGTGIDELKQALESLYFSGDLVVKEDYYLTNIRQKESLTQARESLVRVQRAIDEGVGEDLYVSDLMDAYRSLGLIIGEELEDDLAEKIFATFCLGK